MMSFKPQFAWRMVFALGAIASCVPGVARADDHEMVTISYVLPPAQGLPPGMRTVSVADFVADSNEPHPLVRGPKWSAISADMVESMLRAAQADGSPLINVPRRETRAEMLRQAGPIGGVMPPDVAGRLCQSINVNGVVVGQVQVRIDDVRRKPKVDWNRILGGVGARPGAGPYEPRYRRPVGDDDRERAYRKGYGRTARQVTRLDKNEIDEINRALTVQCSFLLIDGATGRVVAQFAPPAMQRRDRRPPEFFFGRFVEDADLDPIDFFIGELVEKAAHDFVSQIAPTRVEAAYDLHGSGDDFRDGLRALRRGEYSAALRAFEDAHEDKPKKGEFLFAIGVTRELMGDPQGALNYYQRAVSAKDVEDKDMPVFLSARDRLSDHIRRLPGGFIEVGPGAQRPPEPPGRLREMDDDDDRRDLRERRDRDDDDDEDD